jgi:hypothetical protein
MTDSKGIEIPVQFTHSVKIEEMAKGIRISVHVYTNDQQKAIQKAFDTYLISREYAKVKNMPLAPMSVSVGED